MLRTVRFFMLFDRQRSWSLYALRLACDFVPVCPPGGATYLEFSISGAFFLASLVAVFSFRKALG